MRCMVCFRRFFVLLFQHVNCAGSVIDENFVVTAVHCVCGTQKEGVSAIDYRNEKHKAIAAYWDPNCKIISQKNGFKDDMTVLEFAGEPFTSHDARQMYLSGDEVGKTIWIMGMGIMGQPDNYKSQEKCRGKEDKKFREEFNTVDFAGKGILQCDMMESGPRSHPQEAIAEDGDRGGPALIESSDEDW
mmetsp:Transcript_41910/g.82160  ORF Transcript_41910/g.82160 Transcript_41910/m.82160 type:complete len:188 (+) Transcript_41910:20-583(+)